MPTPANVVEDGVAAREKGARGRRWTWFIAGIVLGAGLASVVITLGDPVEPSGSSELIEQGLAEPDRAGVGEVISDFPDGLVAVSSPDGQTLELITWPTAGASFARPIPLGTFPGPEHVEFDSSGRQIASLRTIPGEEGFGLYAGPPASVRLVAAGVTGYAWHDTQSGALVFSTVQGGRTLLSTLTGTRRVPERLLALDAEGAVVGWGEWGLVVQHRAEEMVTLVDETGSVVTTKPGRFLGSSPKGMMAMHDERLYVLAAVGLSLSHFVDPVEVGETRVVSFSPDGEMYAVQGSEGLAVFTTVYGERVMSLSARVGAPSIVWSSDGRFVVSPSTRGAIVLDTREGTSDYILEHETLHGLALLPVSG